MGQFVRPTALENHNSTVGATRTKILSFYQFQIGCTLSHTIKIWIIHSHTFAHLPPKISAESAIRHLSNWPTQLGTEAKNNKTYQFLQDFLAPLLHILSHLSEIYITHTHVLPPSCKITAKLAFWQSINQPRSETNQMKTAFFTMPPKVPIKKIF